MFTGKSGPRPSHMPAGVKISVGYDASHRKNRRSVSRGPVAGLSVGLALVWAALLMLQGPGTALGDIPAARSPTTTAIGNLPGSSDVPQTRARIAGAFPAAPAAAAGRQATGFVPDRLVIPRLAVDAPVVPVSVGRDGSLGVPDDPAVLGWWAAGARPSSATGSVVIDGHVNSARLGRGALLRLSSLVPGDVISIRGQGGLQRYVVAAREQYRKTSLPASAFDQGVQGRLVLITCGGRFDRRTGHYTDNVVVFARPV